MTDPQPCFVLVYPGGLDVVDPHFPAESIARERATSYERAEFGGVPYPKKLDQACVRLTCADCGEQFDQEGENWIVHFGTNEEAFKAADDFDWTIRGDQAWCSECPPEGAA